MILTTMFRFIWQSGFREDSFRNQPSEIRIACGGHVCKLNEQYLIKGLPRMFPYQVSIHLAKRLQRTQFLRNRPIINKNYLWRPCSLNRSELNENSLQMTFEAFFIPCFHSFVKVVSEKKIFQKSTNQKQELLLAAMFVSKSELHEQSL